jgi:YfiH family protein
MIPICLDNSLLKFELLEQYKGSITNFVTSRHGGFSKDSYATFNPSPYSGDNTENVAKNLNKLEMSLPQMPKRIFRPRQVHGIALRVIDHAFLSSSEEKQKELLTGIDAICTDIAGYAVCVSTADCVPILIYDRRHRAIAAVHAGWRGTVQRILVHTLNSMNKLYGTQGTDVIACIGPSISLQSFEIGEEVYETFREANFPMSDISIWNNKTNKHHIDLWKANSLQLQEWGIPVGQIELAGICTYVNCNDFFSARRLGIKSGRILTGIMINQ